MKCNYVNTISSNDYNILMACKGNLYTSLSPLENVQEYLKESLMNINYLSYSNLFWHLTKAVVNICSKKELEHILIHDISYYFDSKIINETINNKKAYNEVKLNYEDLCNILINKLQFLNMRQIKNDENIDLFNINDKGQIYSMKEYDKLTLERKK